MPNKRKALRIAQSDKTTESQGDGFFGRFRWGESYSSLILGIIVVVVATFLVVNLIRGRREAAVPSEEVSSDKTEKVLEEIEQSDLPTEYTVVAGDTLWGIAEKVYESGYNWVDIAQTNKLANPDIIYSGTKLTLPKVETNVMKTAKPEDPKSQIEQKITGDSYKVVRGDNLWNIAVRAYADGYKWVEIAKANNLANPSLIHADNVLKIPR